MPDPAPTNQRPLILGVAILGLLTVGVGGIVHTLILGSPFGLIASAISFGCLGHLASR